ncbi:hypothetical protein J1N35_022334 [Gossypium stocksii]|uniref:Uncharacterized protein n=1 Tax=Gossypium stocksii TaxID=47602 RepID=A0A9D3VGG6_9ROSI|nr:hypothetical protein J1N35_022334 [Gossypium stocksii]
MSSARSPDQANSLVTVARFSSHSHTSNTSPPTLVAEIDASALLDTVYKIRGVVTAPLRTMTDTDQKRPRVEGNTQDTEGNDRLQLAHPRLKRRPAPLKVITHLASIVSPTLIVLVESTNFVDSPVHAVNPPTIVFMLERRVTAEYLNFNVYNPDGKDWEKF